MKIEVKNGVMVLTPDDAKVLTNGDTFSNKVYLGINDSSDNWWEINIQNLPEDIILQL